MELVQAGPDSDIHILVSILLQKSLTDISGITCKRPFSMSENTELDPTRVQRF